MGKPIAVTEGGRDRVVERRRTGVRDGRGLKEEGAEINGSKDFLSASDLSSDACLSLFLKCFRETKKK